MATAKSRRAYGRIELIRTVAITFDNGVGGIYRTKDISLTGMSVQGASTKPLSTPCTIVLAERWGDMTCRISFCGQVVRNTSDGIAVSYTNMAIEAYELLQTILLYGSDNPVCIGEEFSRDCPYPVFDTQPSTTDRNRQQSSKWM